MDIKKIANKAKTFVKNNKGKLLAGAAGLAALGAGAYYAHQHANVTSGANNVADASNNTNSVAGSVANDNTPKTPIKNVVSKDEIEAGVAKVESQTSQVPSNAFDYTEGGKHFKVWYDQNSVRHIKPV